MRILHITPTFFPATYWGGPIFSTYGLCNALASIEDVSLRVLTTDSGGPRYSDRVVAADFPMSYPPGYGVYFCRRWWGASFSPGLMLKLWSMIKWADVVHLTAVYSSPTIPSLFVCRILKKPVVWSPRGSLQRWDGTSHSLAKMIWEDACKLILRKDFVLLHVTSEYEAQASTARMGTLRAITIPNGVKLPTLEIGREWMPEGMLRILFLGRLHPIKGLEQLLQAVAKLKDQCWVLSVCGDGEPTYVKSLIALTKELGISQRVMFVGHIDEMKKREVFSCSDLCILPSFSENFGMVVVEALAHGVPVIASRGTPWREIEEEKCGLWVENSPFELYTAIDRIRNADLQELGRNGRAWMEREFSWIQIANKIRAAYQSMISERCNFPLSR